MKLLRTTLATCLLTGLAAAQSEATVIVTYAEQPGIVASTFIHSSTYDFNSLTAGVHSNVAWDGVGSFDTLNILNADQYGGANNSMYAVEGLGSVSKTVLNLNSPSSYFGLWWSAGDAANVIDFYSGAGGTGTLVAEFTTTNLLKALGGAYKGNPTPGPFLGKDAGEPFAFINFFATPNSAWSSVVFKNSAGSGLEADNYASRVAVYDPTTDGPMPGVVLEAINGKTEVSLVPEPNATMAMILIGAVSFSSTLLRRFKKTTPLKA